FDLPIALGVLAATGRVTRRDVSDVLLMGELSLDGAIQPARGVLPVAAAARRDRYRGLLLPHSNAAAAAGGGGPQLFAGRSLPEAVDALNNPESFRLTAAVPPPAAPARTTTDGDFADVHGQALAKRALEIGAAGGHNTLMVGPPGAGKTMMARRV